MDHRFVHASFRDADDVAVGLTLTPLGGSPNVYSVVIISIACLKD